MEIGMNFSFLDLGGRPGRLGRGLPVSFSIALLALATSRGVTLLAFSNGNSFVDFIESPLLSVCPAGANQSVPLCSFFTSDRKNHH
jgi:hypothetical protein